MMRYFTYYKKVMNNSRDDAFHDTNILIKLSFKLRYSVKEIEDKDVLNMIALSHGDRDNNWSQLVTKTIAFDHRCYTCN